MNLLLLNILFTTVAALGKVLEVKKKPTSKVYLDTAHISLSGGQNRFLSLPKVPSKVYKGTETLEVIVPPPLTTYVWELTGFYLAKETGDHTFSIGRTRMAIIQLGWKNSDSKIFSKQVVDDTHVFNNWPKTFHLNKGEYYPVKITYISGLDYVPIYVTFNDEKKEINRLVYTLAKDTTESVPVSKDLKAYQETGFSFLVFVAPPGKRYELLFKNYVDFELIAGGRFDENYTKVSPNSVNSSFILEIIGHIVPPLDGKYTIKLEDSLITCIQIGSGFEHKKQKYTINDNWVRFDNLELSKVNFDLKKDKYYPFRIVVLSDQEILSWQTLVRDPRNSPIDLFGPWKNPEPSKITEKNELEFKSDPKVESSNHKGPPLVNLIENIPPESPLPEVDTLENSPPKILGSPPLALDSNFEDLEKTSQLETGTNKVEEEKTSQVLTVSNELENLKDLDLVRNSVKEKMDEEINELPSIVYSNQEFTEKPSNNSPEKLPENILSGKFAPKRILPEKNSPDSISPESIFPEGIYPEGFFPGDIFPDGFFPKDILPQEMFPEKNSSESNLTYEKLSENELSENNLSGITSPEGSTPENVLSEKGIPENLVPENISPGNSLLENILSENGKSENLLAHNSQNNLPESILPGNSVIENDISERIPKEIHEMPKFSQTNYSDFNFSLPQNKKTLSSFSSLHSNSSNQTSFVVLTYHSQNKSTSTDDQTFLEKSLSGINSTFSPFSTQNVANKFPGDFQSPSKIQDSQINLDFDISFGSTLNKTLKLNDCLLSHECKLLSPEPLKLMEIVSEIRKEKGMNLQEKTEVPETFVSFEKDVKHSLEFLNTQNDFHGLKSGPTKPSILSFDPLTSKQAIDSRSDQLSKTTGKQNEALETQFPSSMEELEVLQSTNTDDSPKLHPLGEPFSELGQKFSISKEIHPPIEKIEALKTLITSDESLPSKTMDIISKYKGSSSFPKADLFFFLCFLSLLAF